ncbi:hypothetical protein P7K49_032088, partial [Saguinus oedipus]
AGNACFEISPQKAFPDFPFNTRVYDEFYCYSVICGNSAGNACFEISPQKAFSDFPFNTRVYVEIDSRLPLQHTSLTR